ncbi:hypothetical protein G7059_01235 [Erysipelothrix sp. HDW6A]|uniref:hypothetical protein n=1 Tax=Erysipelothrix sp. HDW6A TaxID=2714928 RepID=UPI001408D27C|nr:hypothetical protein [Erysipelothrix sp. HDW6A]QIK56561.1 hypothetical protein G7059_01235 [Erysipelothrix sp. HDW6A]
MNLILITQIFAVVLAISAIPLGIYLYNKKIINNYTIIAILAYLAFFSNFEGTPIFAWNTNNIILRFINDYLIINLCAAALTFIAVAIAMRIINAFTKKK